MNHIAIIKKHLNALEAAYNKIHSDDTKKRCSDDILCTLERLGLRTVTGAPTIAPQSSETVGGITVFPKPAEPQGDALLAAMQGDGVIATGLSHVVASSEEPAIEGDLPGATGTFYYETAVASVGQSATESIGGWPTLAEVEIIGLAPNRRSLKAKLVQDGRSVSVERSLQNWKAADRVSGKLVRAGQYPMYRKVG